MLSGSNARGVTRLVWSDKMGRQGGWLMSWGTKAWVRGLTIIPSYKKGAIITIKSSCRVKYSRVALYMAYGARAKETASIFCYSRELLADFWRKF